MKRLILGLVLLFVSYFAIQWAVVYLSKGHDVSYTIKKDNYEFAIQETFKSNQKKDKDNYFIQIAIEDITFDYQVFDSFEKASKIITDIYYYHNENQACMLPKFKDSQFLFDILCFDGEIFKYYHNIEKPSDSLVSFAKSLSEYGYDEEKWLNSNKTLSKQDSITVYNNLLDNYVIGMSNYKGTFKITSAGEIENYSVFSSDVYQRSINHFINNFYITFDSTDNKFIIVDLADGSSFDIVSEYSYGPTTYVLGSVDNSLYLYDKEQNVEYELNIKKKGISTIANEENFLKVYSNQKWSNIEIAKIAEYDTFSKIETTSYNKDYDLILKDGYEDGYLYYFKKDNNKYDVYRTNIKDQKKLTYLFSTTDLNRLVLLDNIIYYLNNNDLYYYSDKTGNKKLLTNSELEFNKTINFGIYRNK